LKLLHEQVYPSRTSLCCAKVHITRNSINMNSLLCNVSESQGRKHQLWECTPEVDIYAAIEMLYTPNPLIEIVLFCI